MRETQKVIKYLGIAFAVFLIFTIISTIMFSVSSLTNIFDDRDSVQENLESLELASDAVVLNIDVDSINITIKQGDTFEVKTNSEYIKSKQDGNQLIISEKDHAWFFDHEDNDLVVYVPKEYIFDAVSIHSGAGKITVDTLNTKNLYFDLGAGKITIDHLIATEQSEINGGAGKFTINDGELHNLKISAGAGKLTLTSKLVGTSEIDCGVGKVNINLLGSVDDYKIEIDEGIGSIDVDQLSKHEDYYGNGSNLISIDGGVGSIDVRVKN